PNTRPMNISSSVSAVSKNAVLNVFPISSPYRIDAAWGRRMHPLERTEDARVLATIKFTIAADFRGSRGLFQSFVPQRTQRNQRDRREKRATDQHGFSRILFYLILDDL